MEQLKLNWWMLPPVDFEHKKWLLFAYLKKQKSSFDKQIYSPWLLHSEKLINNMKISFTDLKKINIKFDSTFNDLKNEEFYENVKTYKEILEFSIPLLEDDLNYGWKLWVDNPTLLF